MACRPPRPPAARDIPYKQRGIFLQEICETCALETLFALRRFTLQQFLVSIYQPTHPFISRPVGATPINSYATLDDTHLCTINTVPLPVTHMNAYQMTFNNPDKIKATL